MQRFWWFPPLVVVAHLGVPTPQLTAQQPKPSVVGIVVDSAGNALVGAEVELVGARAKTLTAENGSFRFIDLRPTRYWLLVRRIGYYPQQISLTLKNGETRETRFVLAAHPYQLPEVAVRAQDNQYRSRMRDFLWRSRSAFGGRFLTRDDIERNRASELGQLVVRYMPFKSLWAMNEPGGWGPNPFDDDEATSFTRHSIRRRYRPDCPPSVALNGGGVSVGWAVNDFDPAEVEAVEIYREGSDLPIEYTFANRTACGLVVIWLKSYARPGQSG